MHRIAIVTRQGVHPAWLLAATLAAAAFACTAGHDDTPVAKQAPLDVPSSWQSVRESAGHVSHVSARQIACTECHAQGKSFDTPGPGPCMKCHEPQGRIEHATKQAQAAFGGDARSDCTSCHVFAPQEASSQPNAWSCTRCHTPHATGAAAAPGPAHDEAPCQGCHTPHGDAVARATACSTCHAGVSSSHGREAPVLAAAASLPGAHGGLEQPCVACHLEPHAPEAAAIASCEACHALVSPKVGARALFARGHERCVDCHKPHDFSAHNAADCRSCHEDHSALAAQRVPAHAPCSACHQPHDVKNDPAQACASCHRQLSTDHPAAVGRSTCTTCHAPHPRAHAGQGSTQALAARPAAVSVHSETASDCSSCHREAAHDKAFHANELKCTACHEPHHFKLQVSDTGACARCHGEEAAGVRELGGGHARCGQCHSGLPHEPQASAPRAACASCHAQQAAVVHQGHARCQSCHDVHSGQLEQDCASCHAQQRTTAPQGHATCSSCHEAHSTRVLAACGTCHTAQAKAPHGNIAGGCETCHSAHGPAAKTPPACTTCHQRPSLPALHSVPQHGKCQDCHEAHDKRPRPEVGVCRSCHREQSNHFPDAKQCTGCHLFESL